MFNLRICGIAAGAAFIFSLLIGLVSRAPVPVLFIRPAVFAGCFFALSAFVYILVNHFLPELLDKNQNQDIDPLPGSRINITENDSPPASVQAFLGAQADDSDEDLGNISDLVQKQNNPARPQPGRTAAGMDQNRENGYTNGNLGELTELESLSADEAVDSGGAEPGAPAYGSGESGGGTAGFSGSVDLLPDLDSMAGAFLPSAGDEESDTPEYSVSAPSPKPSSGGKTPAWAGDFNAKDLAAGLRTILNKEKEG